MVRRINYLVTQIKIILAKIANWNLISAGDLCKHPLDLNKLFGYDGDDELDQDFDH